MSMASIGIIASDFWFVFEAKFLFQTGLLLIHQHNNELMATCCLMDSAQTFRSYSLMLNIEHGLSCSYSYFME